MAGWRLWLAQWQNMPRSPAGARHYLPHHPQMRATPSVRAGSVGPAGAGSDSRYPPPLESDQSPRPSSPHCGHKDTFLSARAGMTADVSWWALEWKGLLLHSKKWWWGIAVPIAISRSLPARQPHPRCWGSVLFMQ